MKFSEAVETEKINGLRFGLSFKNNFFTDFLIVKHLFLSRLVGFVLWLFYLNLLFPNWFLEQTANIFKTENNKTRESDELARKNVRHREQLRI